MTGIVNLPADRYHADTISDTPTLSASIAHVLLTSSPRHAWVQHPRLNPDFTPAPDDKFDMGVACHALLLEGLNVVEVCDFPDWRTKAAKEARDLARAHGRIPLLGHQYDDVLQMHRSVAEQLERLELDPLPLTDGKPEQTMVWEEQGVLCRARIDWLHTNGDVADIKTTSRSAHPESWSRNLYAFGCDVQMSLYRRGLKALTGREPAWRWVVIEVAPPYALSIVEPGAAVIALADAKVDRALEIWRECLATDTWPAYPTTVHVAELPAWEESRWLAREAQEMAA